ncbi:MAG: proton-conducting transporter membrane subunit [Rubricella sp.]
MPTLPILFAAAAPILLILASVTRVPRTVTLAGIAALACALIALVATLLESGGSLWLGPLAFRMDALSAVMLTLVAFIGVIVLRYSESYLRGEAGQPTFFLWMGLTIAAVMVMLTAGSLPQFALGWIAMSLGLDQLLLYRGERPGARLAQRQRFIAARISDGAMLGAFLMLWSAFGTADIGAILSAAETAEASGTIHLAALLIAVSALAASAQLPVHGWLTRVMETPTPVSALLHAGIVNAGGFLVLRFSDVMVLSLWSLDLLALAGGLTALVAAIVMMTQTSVKVSLAWSTIAQMGFMLMQCGLGAFHLAALHIVAHSLYKAHAFLSSGSVVQSAAAKAPVNAPAWRMPAALVLALVVTGVAASATATPIGANLGAIALAAILVMGVTHLIAQGIEGRSPMVFGFVVLAGVTVSTLYFLLGAGAAALLGEAVATVPQNRPAFDVLLVMLIVGGFGTVLWAQDQILHRADSRLAILRRHAANGFYIDALWTRATRATA